jgi:hypothetical protein
MTRASVLAAAAVALVLPASASADRVYHSEHLPLVAADGTEHGFVQNIHPNGPRVYAHEIYSLKGALPGTTFQVFLLVHLGDPGCDGSAATDFGSTPLTTNAGGNGTSDRFIPTATVPAAIRNQTHGVRWEVRMGDTVVYEAVCTNVTLD